MFSRFVVHKTIILPVVLYGCETWSLTLTIEFEVRVFENRIQRPIFGFKRDENGEGSTKRKQKIEKGGSELLSNEHNKETQVVFHMSMNLLINSIFANNNNNNNDNTNSMAYGTRRFNAAYTRALQ